MDGAPLAGPQLRFGDGDATRWADRVGALAGAGARPDRRGRSTRCGRCRPRSSATVVAWAAARGAAARAPVRAARRERGLPGRARPHARPSCSPTHGVLGPRTTAVHATHLDRRRPDAARATAGTGVCLCPTTERDLADGIGPARRAGRRRQPAQPGQRQPRRDRPVRGGPRGGAGRAAAHRAARPLHRRRAAGRGDRRRARRAGLGRRRRASRPARAPTWSRCAWTRAPHGRRDRRPAVVFAATAADVAHVVVDGRVVVRDGRHLLVVDVAARRCATAIDGGVPA